MSLKSQFLSFVFGIISFCNVSAQSVQWKKTDEKELSTIEKMKRNNYPDTYQLFQTNLTELTNKLLEAPIDESNPKSNVFVNFPDANGNISLFEIYNSPMMEPELANIYSEIHNFTGINKKDPTNVIKISITPTFGMHIIGYDGQGNTYYIDTFTEDFKTYILYKRSDIKNSNNTFQCLVEGNENEAVAVSTFSENQTLSIDNKFRKYRLAMANTIEYAEYHIDAAPSNVPKSTLAQKKAIVLSAMNVTVNRLNSIYERDLAIRLTLVANNNSIIFIDSDNFSNESPSQLINQSQSVITSIIGNSNYDIGHTVSTGAGGLASPAPCSSQSKARGITGSYAPVGDPFDIDYVAHEVGHQFGASHTFNNFCQGNRQNHAAIEPGSGSTIMAYAGICAPNIQFNSDPYFHSISIKEITSFLTSSSNSCASIVSGTNPTPTITTQGNKTIPHSTPFILTAIGNDSNNPTSLTYTWEQMNNDISTQSPLATSTVGPNFRSLKPTTNSARSFPSVETVLAGTTNNNGVVSTTWERLPSVARSMKFTATVRDNNAVNGGQTKSADAMITFANAGPFVITYPNNVTTTNLDSWAYNSQKTITWNVAGTTANGINTSHVNILLSTDNGQTYTMLAANTPNNGSKTITVPTLANGSTECRIKIEAVGNIFYTVSKPFYINATAATSDFEFENFSLYPNPTSNVVTISFSSKTTNAIYMDIFDIRGRKLKTYNIENTGSITNEIDLSSYDSGVYLIHIKDGPNQSTKKVIKK